jgi:hypothetical protein
MAVVDTAAAAETGGALGVPPSALKSILDLLKVVDSIAHSPLAATAAARFAPRDSTLTNAPIQSGPPMHVSGPVQPGPAAAAPAVDPGAITEEAFLRFLATEKGRVMIANGLEKVKNTVGGDLKISEMIEILRPPKTEENKP